MVKKTLDSIKNLLLSEQNEILSAAALLMAIGIITKVFGLVFYSLSAREFGTSQAMDNFNLASTIPDMITSVILLGAVSGSIIPIFTKAHQLETHQVFSKSFSNVMNFVMLLFGVLALIAVFFSRELIPAAVSISHTTERFDLNEVVWMMRIMLLSQIVLGFSAFFSTWLNIKQRFVIPQLAPLFYNIGKIAGALIFVPLMNGSVWGLVWGTLFGAVLHLLIQIPLLKYLNFNWSVFHLNFKDPNLRSSIKLGMPRILSLAIEQVAAMVDTLIALSFSAITVYKYAIYLIGFPLSLGTSFAIASFPSFSKLKVLGKGEEFSKLFLRIVNEVIYLSLPIAVIFIVLRVPVVRLTFGLLGGKFDWLSTLRVAWLVMFFALGVMFESLRSIIFRVYFSINNTIVPFISSIIVVVAGAVTGIIFSNYFSHFDDFKFSSLTWNSSFFFTRGNGEYATIGLALSSSIVFSLEFFALLMILWKKKVVFGIREFFRKLVLKLFVGLIMLVLCYVLAKFWENVLNTAKTVQLFILTATTSFAAFSVYLLMSYVFAIDEVRIFIKLLNKILKIFKINIEE